MAWWPWRRTIQAPASAPEGKRSTERDHVAGRTGAESKERRSATWIGRKRFREIVGEAVDSIPEGIRRRIENAVVVVEDEPDEETLLDLGLDPAEDSLYGLYQGTPISERGDGFGNALPDRVVIYYLPLTEDFRDEYHLRREIRRTVVHEIGHFFGLSDREIEGMGY
ncbi:MAG TPA: metallopeptidase family protein [Candidatus Binatia bacterium]|nr:metallopeptidase family protein [Candidatus Binatia bacterium]